MRLQREIIIKTEGRGTYNITSQISDLVKTSHCTAGLCHLFLRHTSASLILCENDDPQVREDLETFMQKLVPDGTAAFKHNSEGPDDMPAHVRSILTQNSLIVPIINNEMALGTWQGIFLWEHRWLGFDRKLVVSILD